MHQRVTIVVLDGGAALGKAGRTGLISCPASCLQLKPLIQLGGAGIVGEVLLPFWVFELDFYLKICRNGIVGVGDFSGGARVVGARGKSYRLPEEIAKDDTVFAVVAGKLRFLALHKDVGNHAVAILVAHRIWALKKDVCKLSGTLGGLDGKIVFFQRLAIIGQIHGDFEFLAGVPVCRKAIVGISNAQCCVGVIRGRSHKQTICGFFGGQAQNITQIALFVALKAVQSNRAALVAIQVIHLVLVVPIHQGEGCTRRKVIITFILQYNLLVEVP